MSDSYRGKKFNDTFRGDYPTHWNACVGNNGNPSYRDYAEGFARAAVILINDAIVTRDVDQQIYPICFNMRHAVELSLKYQILMLESIRAESSIGQFDLAGSHDIGNIWEYCKKSAELKDKRFGNLFNDLDGYIKDIAEIDPTGQTFRYPLNKESIKHLVDVSVINIVRLKRKFEHLIEKLDELYNLTNFLIEEYAQDTYTKSLSRKDIEEISNALPKINLWSCESFNTIRDDIKSKYNIGSKELSYCLNVIKSHREFSKPLGIKISLKSCTEEHFIRLFEVMLLIHPLESFNKKSEGVLFDDVLIQRVISTWDEDQENQRKLFLMLHDEFERSTLIDVLSLYDFGCDLGYSERYDYHYSDNVKSFSNITKALLYEEIAEFISKAGVYKQILKALIFLNQYELVDRLDSIFNFRNYFSFVGEYLED